jgi:uncharacterized membrane protein
LIISAILVVLIDYVYLNMVKGFFGKQIRDVQGSAMKVDLLGAALCYVFIIFGLNYFIISRRASVLDAFLLGLVIYGIYELTNKAILNNWRYSTVVVDTLWGATLFASVTFLTYKIDRMLK